MGSSRRSFERGWGGVGGLSQGRATGQWPLCDLVHS